ncbi:uncharacterized protein [Littorina saxatilis]|uniref:EF-hand domain-containing protein n=1 Tax=Littorina saxatilis TaxID=31220 RepID=A0AAN9BE48_9CAEN
MRFLIFAAFFAFVSGQTASPNAQAAVLQQLTAIFTKMDTDSDGELTLSEQLAYFDGVDTNNDGKLNNAEFMASRGSSGQNLPQAPDAYIKATFTFYDTMGGSQPADGFMSRSDVAFFFNLIDGNGDGTANLKEFDQAFIAIGKAIAQMVASTPAAPIGK